MADDIEAWLREHRQPGPMGTHMIRAADEIARLRAALRQCPHCGAPGDTEACGTGGCPLGGDQ